MVEYLLFSVGELERSEGKIQIATKELMHRARSMHTVFDVNLDALLDGFTQEDIKKRLQFSLSPISLIFNVYP